MTDRHRRKSQSDSGNRRGLSLLEVILAIAILGGALATIGELIRIGTQSATMARELSRAEIFCDGIMAEVAAGIMPPETATALPFENQSAVEMDWTLDWLFDVVVVPSNQDGLLNVTVKVYQDPGVYARPVEFSLARLIPDPAYVEALEAEAEELENAFEF